MKKSNCLIQCVNAFINDPRNVVIYKKGSWKLLKRKTFPHFYWFNKKENKYFHFSAKYEDEPFLSQLWFEGTIEEFHFHGKKSIN